MSGRRESPKAAVAAARAAAKRVVLSSRFGPQARRVAGSFGSSAARRDRRDNDALVLLVAACLKEDGSAIDIGANEGRVLREIVRVAPRGSHVAYEPIPRLAADLADRYPMVDVRCAALSDESGRTEFTHVKTSPGYSGLRQRTYPGEEELEIIEVTVERLDDVLPKGFRPSFVKLDVEGAEGKVLAGAIETLARFQPVVAFEHGKGAAPVYGTTPSDIHALLAEQAKLRIFDMDGGGPYSRDQFEEAFELGSYWNFFARA